MQIVIDIPERYFESIKDFDSAIIGRCRGKTIQYQVINAIKHGTPLPKGHGRLIDLNDLYDFDRRKVEYAPTIIEGSESE